VAATVVEVDLLTGEFKVVSTGILLSFPLRVLSSPLSLHLLLSSIDVDVMADCGRSLNPALDVGQIEGGFLMGMGLYTMGILLLFLASPYSASSFFLFTIIPLISSFQRILCGTFAMAISAREMCRRIRFQRTATFPSASISPSSLTTAIPGVSTPPRPSLRWECSSPYVIDLLDTLNYGKFEVVLGSISSNMLFIL